LIGKVCRRGSDTRRLLVYLFTEGQAGERGLESEHRDAHVIAGYDAPGLLEPPRRSTGRADVTRLAGLLDAAVKAGGVGKYAKPVYHLALSAAPGDRTLTEDEWADIAAQYLDRLGLAQRGDSDAVRWVAVRHADNHVHVVATLVRQDGRRVFPHHDFYRAREVSLDVERQYRLTPTSPADRTAGRETTRAELRKHQAALRARAEAGLPPPAGPDREVLRARVRAALAGAQDWEEFTERLRRFGVQVRERYSTRHPEQVTGYAVALLPHGTGSSSDEQSIWFGGGKLAPDLSLPQLRARWDAAGGADTPTGGPDTSGRTEPPRRDSTTHSRRQPEMELSELERRRLWLSAQHCVRDAAKQIRQASGAHASPGDRAAAQAAAAAASEMLQAVSWLVEHKRGGPLRDAADSYDRAARDLHRRTVPATARSRTVRSAAGALICNRLVRRAETRQLLALLSDLTSLTESLARLRETQGRAAQAQAARRTSEQLAAEHTRRATAASAAVAPLVRRAAAAGLPTTPYRPTSTQTGRPSSASR
jgi:hypothetical protein